MKKITLCSLIIIIIDQLIKLLVINLINPYSSINIINSFFNITYVKNIGAAFSILSGNTFLLIIITLIALAAIYLFLIKNKKINKLELISYSLLIGGIIGNLFDRIFRGYVIDYLDFNLFGYNFPVFNFADICIVCSVFVILIMSFKEKKV